MANKLILIAIAAGLWVNVAISLTRPARAQADFAQDIGQIAYDIHQLIHGGNSCENRKICN
jgi:hypothetical protein